MYTHTIILIYTGISVDLGSFKILLWGCNHYIHGVTFIILQQIIELRAESQSGLTHEKYIPTYQFENTLCVSEAADDSCYFTPHPLRYV